MKRSHVFTLLKLLLALSLVAFVINQAGIDNIEAALTNIDRRGWLMGCGLILVANCLAMVRWHMLMHSVGLNILRTHWPISIQKLVTPPLWILAMLASQMPGHPHLMRSVVLSIVRQPWQI